MTTNASTDYSLEMNSTHLLDVKYKVPEGDPSGKTSTESDYLSADQQQALWQSMSFDEMDAYFQTASARQAAQSFQYMSPEQAAHFFDMANGKESNFALVFLPPETLAAMLAPPLPFSDEEMVTALASLTTEQQTLAAEIDQLIGEMMLAQANHNPQKAEELARQISDLSKELSTSISNDPAYPSYNTNNLGDVLAAFADWIESINNLMGTVALGVTNLANATMAYLTQETLLLNQSLDGDEWNEDWADEPATDNPGKSYVVPGSGEDPYYCPGINNIPPDATGPDNEDYTAYWQANFNQNYQLILTTYQAWAGELQSWTQSGADVVNNISQSTQNDYNNIGSINDIMENLQILTQKAP